MNGTNTSAINIVKQFWQLMATNNFHSVTAILSDDFLLEWPQSNERIRGGNNFALMNVEYPANGLWTFTINRLIGSVSEAVSDVSITDGVQCMRAVSFFTVTNGKISRIVEYWPEAYPAPANRQHLVEPIN
ncbi:hypothetical protein AAKU61_000458 [Undibacterium sp. GrIS 1.2]|uniref:nuclear transport factor 2 family protein n=1 Tax=Undibacterium sp. GrIS 1.2 TaxID=3143933 RepID=UPI003395C6E5